MRRRKAPITTRCGWRSICKWPASREKLRATFCHLHGGAPDDDPLRRPSPGCGNFLTRRAGRGGPAEDQMAVALDRTHIAAAASNSMGETGLERLLPGGIGLERTRRANGAFRWRPCDEGVHIMLRNAHRNAALVAALMTMGFAGTLQTSAALAAGQTSTATATTATSSAVPAADRNFAMKAAQGGLAEVEMGKLAQANAQNDQVKSF